MSEAIEIRRQLGFPQYNSTEDRLREVFQARADLVGKVVWLTKDEYDEMEIRSHNGDFMRCDDPRAACMGWFDGVTGTHYVLPRDVVADLRERGPRL